MPEQETLSILLNLKFMGKEIWNLHQFIKRTVEESFATAFGKIWIQDIRKHLVYVDLAAERSFTTALYDAVGQENLVVVGEETLTPNIDFTHEQRYCVLLDMVDGTDLLQREFSNWCSAVVIFNPSRSRIEGAFVTLSEKMMYYATENRDGAFKIPLREARAGSGEPTRLSIAKKSRLKDAGVCIYAQKSGALLGFMERYAQSGAFQDWLRRIADVDKKTKGKASGGVEFRFYNLAGNPMMVHLGDGSVDLVLELVGQQPHDFVAGAFIAMKAGAVLGDADKRKIYTEADLASMLFRPAQVRHKYILASSVKLYEEALKTLKLDKTTAPDSKIVVPSALAHQPRTAATSRRSRAASAK